MPADRSAIEPVRTNISERVEVVDRRPRVPWILLALDHPNREVSFRLRGISILTA